MVTMDSPQYDFPVLPISEILGYLHVFTPSIAIRKSDIETPQFNFICNLYMTMMQKVFENMSKESFHQLQFQAGRGTSRPSYPELFTDGIPIFTLTKVMQIFLKVCGVNDVKIADIVHPTSKKTVRLLSAMINTLRFMDARRESFLKIKTKFDAIHKHIQQKDEMQHKINEINCEKEEKIPYIKDQNDKIDQLNLQMTEKKNQLSEIKATVNQQKAYMAEHDTKNHQLTVNYLSKKQRCEFLENQIVQSPDRVKTDFERILNKIDILKKEKEEQEFRLEDISQIDENQNNILNDGTHRLKVINSITYEAEKQKKALKELESVRDKTAVEKDTLRDLSAEDNQRARQLENKEEKSAKIKLQHKSKMTCENEAKERLKREWEDNNKWKDGASQQISEINSQKQNFIIQYEENRQPLKENMENSKILVSKLLEKVDLYHQNVSHYFKNEFHHLTPF